MNRGKLLTNGFLTRICTIVIYHNNLKRVGGFALVNAINALRQKFFDVVINNNDAQV